MGFDFTVAITPSLQNIDRELQYVKSALLYADKVTLISPLVYLYTQLSTRGNRFDEKALIRILNYVLPLCEEETETYRQGKSVIDQMSAIVFSKQYKAIPMTRKLELRKILNDAAKLIDDRLLQMIGAEQSHQLNDLLRSDKLILKKFEHSLADTNGCVSEYFEMLKASVHDTFPLFDEVSNNLMALAVKSRIIRLSDTDCRKITHAGVSDNIIHRLPSFDSASVDEILDIRKELTNPLVRFRSKMLEYSDNIQAMPWDKDFTDECTILYEKEITPAILEIEERTKATGFVKNLAKSVITDGNFLKSTVGLAVGIAAAGVISPFRVAVSADAAIIATGGAWAVQKIATTYEECHKAKRETEKNDLYFYYQAGKFLDK